MQGITAFNTAKIPPRQALVGSYFALFESTGLTPVGRSFTVTIGPPTSLVVEMHSAGGVQKNDIAIDGAGFAKLPSLTVILVDAAGNRGISDGQARLTCPYHDCLLICVFPGWFGS